MRLNDYKISVLGNNITYQFDCEDDDLNDFFHNDALLYQNQLLSKTFCWLDGDNVVLFLSISNDNIELKSSKKRKKFERSKHFWYYPAVKIGRLGVDKGYKGEGLGTQALTFIKYFFVVKNKTGCRFLTLDAYNKESVISFYQKNSFVLMSKNDENDKTRIMYYDLIGDYEIIRSNSSSYKSLSNMVSSFTY